MYIISKHKDFYDGVAGTTGIDKSIVYERYHNVIDDENKFLSEFKYTTYKDKEKNPFLHIDYYYIDDKKNNKYNNCDAFIIGFCGKLYIGWKFYYTEKIYNDGIYEDVQKTDIIYGYENVKDIIKVHYWRINIENDINYITNYKSIEMFRILNAPVFIFYVCKEKYRNFHQMEINPVLKDWEFYKLFDAFQTFQEIQMFISGVLGKNEKEIIDVDDKYKIAQYGFNEWSFRKEPKVKIN